MIEMKSLFTIYVYLGVIGELKKEINQNYYKCSNID